MKRNTSAMFIMALASVLTLVIFTQNASAQFLDFSASNIKYTLQSILESVISAYQNSTDIFFIRLLLLIIIFVITNTAVKAIPKIGESKGVVLIISAVVSILAIKGMSDDLITMILLPYGSMGIAFATILPFFIFFYFVHATKMGGAGRRLSWILFAISFGAVFYNRYADITETGRYFYLACVLAILIAFVFDKGIHHYFFLHELSLFYKGANQKTIASLQAEYLNIVHVDTPEAEARKTKIQTQLKNLGADLP